MSKRNVIIKKFKDGNGAKKISKELSLPLSTMKAIIAKWKKFGSIGNQPRSGHLAKITKKITRKLVRDVKANPQMTLSDLQGSVSAAGVDVDKTTISKVLHKAGLFG